MFLCVFCGEKFEQAASLPLHKRLVHTDAMLEGDDEDEDDDDEQVERNWLFAYRYALNDDGKEERDDHRIKPRITIVTNPRFVMR